MAARAFERLSKEIKPENRQFVAKNLAICRQVRQILAHHPSINTQKKLATALGKEPSEISKWLNGLHNIGLENITRMEAILNCDIILTDEQAKERYLQTAAGGFETSSIVHASHSMKVFISYSCEDSQQVSHVMEYINLCKRQENKSKEHQGMLEVY